MKMALEKPSTKKIIILKKKKLKNGSGSKLGGKIWEENITSIECSKK